MILRRSGGAMVRHGGCVVVGGLEIFPAFLSFTLIHVALGGNG